AEDGIRDYKVTGVQTCALPIFDDVAAFLGAVMMRLRQHDLDFLVMGEIVQRGDDRPTVHLALVDLLGAVIEAGGIAEADRVGGRSEERRVGKECRYVWWGCH